MSSNNGSNPPNQLHRNVPGSVLDSRLVGSQAPRAVPLSSHYLQQPMSASSTSVVGGLPPVPIRRNPVSSYGRMGMGMGMGGMGGYYSPYSRYPTNMYTPGYGGYGRMSPYGHYGSGEGANFNSFIQMAEESTRPAFESIESVVEVVGSISMMLESTYHAVHSSYSAILGVVDQFSRLRDHLAQMLSILALLRGLRWLCLKVLYVLKLRKDNPSDEAAWSTAEAALSGGNLPPRPDKGGQGSAWPFLMFISLVIGAPWLMFKLLSKSVSKKPLDLRMFRDENGRRHMSTAAYDFKATQRDELSFSAGERLFLAPASYKTGPKGWIYACNSKQETGLVPQNYLATVSAATTKPKKPAASTFITVPQTAEQPVLESPNTPFEQSSNTTVNTSNPGEMEQTNVPAEIAPAQPKEKETESESGVEC